MAFEIYVLVLSDERASEGYFTPHSVILTIDDGQTMRLDLPLEF